MVKKCDKSTESTFNQIAALTLFIEILEGRLVGQLGPGYHFKNLSIVSYEYQVMLHFYSLGLTPYSDGFLAV
jgi:hypothetical protein